MRQDQYERLQALSEKLMDVFLEEGDPGNWPGHGLTVSTMDAQTRGDRYWSKKNAAATGVLFTRVEAMIGSTQEHGGTTPPLDPQADHESQLDESISSAEREAARLMRELQKGGTAKAAFDKRVHGKA